MRDDSQYLNNQSNITHHQSKFVTDFFDAKIGRKEIKIHSPDKLIVHELEPKKWVFDSGRWTEHNINFWQPQAAYFLEKYDQLSESVAFGQKLRHFTDQNRPKGGTHENEF